MTVLAAVCTKIPEAKLGIILLPVVSFSAGNVSVGRHISLYLVLYIWSERAIVIMPFDVL